MQNIEKLRVFTAFSGYDSQCLALKRLGIDFDLIGWSEIDKHAIKAHNLFFPEYTERNYGDITKIDWEKVDDFDLFTYSFPCTDISFLGQRKGLTEGSNTRSSLLWECKKAIDIKRPKYLLLENVLALVQGGNKKHFINWLNILQKLGYHNYVSILSPHQYNVPQTRHRVFVVSTLERQYYSYPTPIKQTIFIKDILEKDDDVDKGYFLSQKQFDYITKKRNKWNKDKSDFTKESQYCGCISARYYQSRIGAIPHLRLGKNKEIARVLTEREVGRLMGLNEKEITLLINNIPKTRLYYMLGNSIVVDILEAIFRKMFIEPSVKLELFS